MLLKKLIKEQNKKLISKQEEGFLDLNKYIIDVFIKNNLRCVMDISKCFNSKIFELKDFEKILDNSRINGDFIRKSINENNFNSNELMNLLISKNKENKFFNINNIFDSFVNNQKDNKDKPYMFDETDLEILYKKNKNTKFLSSQKNINFIFKKEYYNDEILKDLVVNKNLSKETIKLIINNENIINNIFLNYDNKSSFLRNIKLDSEIIDTLINKNLITNEDLILNINLTEDLILKYLPEEKYKELDNVKLSKDFLKKNINILKYNVIFTNLNDDISKEYFIINIINNELSESNISPFSQNYEEEKTNFVFNILKKIKYVVNLDTLKYDSILDTFNINGLSVKNIENYSKLFNEKTSSERISLYFDYINSKEKNLELNMGDEYTINQIIKECDIPEKIIESNFRLFSNYNQSDEIDYNLFLSNQKIPKNLLFNNKFINDVIDNKNLHLILKHQIDNKKELQLFINAIKKYKNDLVILIENKDYLNSVLLENKNYIIDLKNNEIIKNIKNSNEKLNYFYIFLVMKNNEDKLKMSPRKSDYGVSLY